ncbi:MAG TPA: PAS domain S-box protein [Candidatus Aquilonibacter sp.]|nr:PAS domain S-box protein [Candidatus Aquilonibacter sp.]
MSSVSDNSRVLEEKLELVAQTALLLARTAHFESLVQRATDAGLQVVGAQYGAFLYNLPDRKDVSRAFYRVSIDENGSRSSVVLPQDSAPSGPSIKEGTIIRSRNINRDVRFRGPLPNDAMPHAQRDLSSYLSVAVRNLAGDVQGALVYAHEEADVFDEAAEVMVGTIAAQMAVAIENSRLREQLTRRVADLEASYRKQKIDAKRLGELAAIVESSDDAIISKGLDGIITSWNAAATRILGYTADEIIGKSVLTIIPEHLHADEPVIISTIRSGKRLEHFETQRKTKRGDLLDVSLTVSPVKDENGTIIGASKILRDISAKKRLENSLIQAEKIAATGRMAATIAHEINNPLEAVLNLLYLLRPLVNDSEGRNYLNTAEMELSRVAHIAKQTLGYYREQATASKVSLRELVEHAVTVYRPRCLVHNISIESRLESDAKIYARRGEMMQVISNLIANSIYAMPDGGTLRLSVISVKEPNPGFVLSVEDTGTGIPPENLNRVFDAFFTTRMTIGTGIGLFVAKQFVEGHGGSIALESSVDPPAQGTTVSIFLPLQTRYEKIN